MNLARRRECVFILFALLIVATRWPLAPAQLFSFDDVNLAYSIGHFDIRTSQPQPPGYPLFVMQMRALTWLRFHRAESILLALSLAASLAAVLLAMSAGKRIFGRGSGFWAACLLALNPVFWHEGLASAIRVQLAVVSLATAAACWRAWRGDGRWVAWSAIVLGIGAGIRPDAGPLLFPLWAACSLRAQVKWRTRALGMAALAGAVLLWLAPTTIASGGPTSYFRICTGYISDQASITSGLFGATETQWLGSFWHLMAWLACGALGLTLPAALAWRRKDGWGIGGERATFLLLWIAPSLTFSLLVHVQDPGHTLIVVPAIALAGGYLIERALDNAARLISRWQAPIFILTTAAIVLVADRCDPRVSLVAVPLAALAAGMALRTAPAENTGGMLRWHMAALLLAPALLLDCMIFLDGPWYYRGSGAAVDRAIEEIHSGLSQTSLAHVRNTAAVDDHAILQMRRLVAERPGRAVVIWERGPTGWRKAAYYAPDTRVVALDRKKTVSGPLAVIAVWKGPVVEKIEEGAAPLRLDVPAGARIVWLLNPRSRFFEVVRNVFPLTAAGTVYYTDLPREAGSRAFGDYEVAW